MSLRAQLTWLVALAQQLWRMLAGPKTPPMVLPSSADETELLAAARRCIGCGSCDRSFDAWPGVARDQFAGPMALVFRAALGPTSWPRLGPMVGALERGNLGALEADCPVHIPFVSLARVLRSKVPPSVPKPRPKKRNQHDPG